jgi:hypothetical protein
MANYIPPVDPITHSKLFWQDYVRSVQYEAGLFFGAQVDDKAFKQYQNNGWKPDLYRPTTLYYTDNSWNWNTTPVTSTHSTPAPSSTETQEEKEKREAKERAERAKILGTIFTIVTGFLFGIAYQAFVRQNEAQGKTFVAINSCEKIKHDNDQQRPVKENLKKLLETQRKIDEIYTNKINTYFGAAAEGLLGAIILAGGGFSAKSWLITTGQMLLVMAASIAAANCAMHWQDHSTLSKLYKEILGSQGRSGLASHILQHLNNCNDKLIPFDESRFQNTSVLPKTQSDKRLPSNDSELQSPPDLTQPLADGAPPPYASIFPDYENSAGTQR